MSGSDPSSRTPTVSSTQPAELQKLKNQPRKAGEAGFFYYDHQFQANAVKVLPGEYFVSGQNIAITTVLGSCIAACIWDSEHGVGGMNHFMLPDGDSNDVSGRYGLHAMETLISEIQKVGGHRDRLQAKIFGGGQVMSGFATMNVGQKNTRFVIDYLQAERIHIVSQDVLDIYPRRVVFFPKTGRALVKRLAHSHPDVPDASDRKGTQPFPSGRTPGMPG